MDVLDCNTEIFVVKFAYWCFEVVNVLRHDDTKIAYNATLAPRWRMPVCKLVCRQENAPNSFALVDLETTLRNRPEAQGCQW